MEVCRDTESNQFWYPVDGNSAEPDGFGLRHHVYEERGESFCDAEGMAGNARACEKWLGCSAGSGGKTRLRFRYQGGSRKGRSRCSSGLSGMDRAAHGANLEGMAEVRGGWSEVHECVYEDRRQRKRIGRLLRNSGRRAAESHGNRTRALRRVARMEEQQADRVHEPAGGRLNFGAAISGPCHAGRRLRS